MTAFHRRLITEEFRRCGGALTTAQLAAVAGPNWTDRVKEMRRHGYPLDGETVEGLWHLDLEELPESELPDPDAGGTVDAGPSRSVCERDDSSPGTGSDPQVEGETEPLTLGIEGGQRRPASPYEIDTTERSCA